MECVGLLFLISYYLKRRQAAFTWSAIWDINAFLILKHFTVGKIIKGVHS
jgi:hypothetical protein